MHNYRLWRYFTSDFGFVLLPTLALFYFYATDNELNGLYDLMKIQMSAEKGTKKSLFLGTSGITLETKKALGSSSLIIYDLTEGASGYFYLSSKQLDKLFGKN